VPGITRCPRWPHACRLIEMLLQLPCGTDPRAMPDRTNTKNIGDRFNSLATSRGSSQLLRVTSSP